MSKNASRALRAPCPSHDQRRRRLRRRGLQRQRTCLRPSHVLTITLVSRRRHLKKERPSSAGGFGGQWSTMNSVAGLPCLAVRKPVRRGHRTHQTPQMVHSRQRVYIRGPGLALAPFSKLLGFFQRPGPALRLPSKQSLHRQYQRGWY